MVPLLLWLLPLAPAAEEMVVEADRLDEARAAIQALCGCGFPAVSPPASGPPAPSPPPRPGR